MRTSIIASIAVLFVCTSLAHAEWPDWRGPTADGRSDATGLPLTWSGTENVAWKTPIHGRGFSTPVVLDGQIWITTAPEDGKALYAVCVDLDSGAVIHDIKIFEPEKLERIHPGNTFATPSAVVEEGRVYVHFGTYGTACLDSATGEVLWEKTDLHTNHLQGPAASPLLFEDFLIVSLEGVDVQFIAALDKKTGEDVWRADRPRDIYDAIDPSVFYFAKAYVTPIIVEVDGKKELVSNGSQCANGYDPYTGEELWRVVYGDDNSIARVITGHGLIFANTGGLPYISRLWAIREGGRGDVTDSHVAWKITEGVGISPSPVLAGDLLYMVSEKGVLTCLEAETGETVWSERLPGKYGASLLYGDNRVYAVNERGLTTVIEHGRTFKELAVNDLELEDRVGIWASPAVAGNSLLIRSETHLYRIQGK